jgi:hypothetical protein
VPPALTASIVLSLVLTLVLNLVLWAFPGLGRWIAERARRAFERSAPRPFGDPDEPRVRVIVPWKLMLVVSIALTVALNVLVRLRP